MGQDRITIDSHALIWYLHEDSKVNLTKKALETIRLAEYRGIIYVPTIVLLEVFRVIHKGKYPLSFDALLSGIEQNPGFQIIPFDVELLKLTTRVQGFELHDSIVFATALMTGTPLVTRNRQIKAKRANVDVIW